MHKFVSHAKGTWAIKMCLSAGITFVARKKWPSARQRNMLVSTYVAMCAHTHLCIRLYICISVCMLAVIPLCVNVHEHAFVCVQARWWKYSESSWRQQPPHCGGWTRSQTPVFPKMNYETKPSACKSPHNWQQGPRPKTWREKEWGWHYRES